MKDYTQPGVMDHLAASDGCFNVIITVVVSVLVVLIGTACIYSLLVR